MVLKGTKVFFCFLFFFFERCILLGTNISPFKGIFESMIFPIPQAGCVTSLEGILLFYRWYSSSDRAWGIVRSSIFTSSYHHPPYPFFTIIFHPPYHQEKSHPSTHFMHPSHYHFSTPFFFTFISSFFFLINHLLLSSHHHLNYAPCPFIEFRLGKNIVSIN